MHIYFSLSVLTELNLREGMKIIDTYGNDHPLTPHQVRVMLAVGWACFLGSWLVNIAYYKFHPSSVDVFSSQDKMELYVLGENVFSEIGRQNLLEDVDVESQKDTIEPMESDRLLAQLSSQAGAEIQCAPEAL